MCLREVASGCLWCVIFLPNQCFNKVSLSENLIHQQAQRRHLVVVDGNEDGAVLAQELLQQNEARIHHRQPAVVPVQRLAFLADHLAQPLADLRAVDVVVVNPALVAGVVGRVDVDALHLSGIAGQQGLERMQVVALHDQVAAVSVAAGQLRHRLQQAERYIFVVFDDGFFADPVQCGHAGPRWLAGTAGRPRCRITRAPRRRTA